MGQGDTIKLKEAQEGGWLNRLGQDGQLELSLEQLPFKVVLACKVEHNSVVTDHFWLIGDDVELSSGFIKLSEFFRERHVFLLANFLVDRVDELATIDASLCIVRRVQGWFEDDLRDVDLQLFKGQRVYSI